VEGRERQRRLTFSISFFLQKDSLPLSFPKDLDYIPGKERISNIKSGVKKKRYTPISLGISIRHDLHILITNTSKFIMVCRPCHFE